jgi:hypothetical protein
MTVLQKIIVHKYIIIIGSTALLFGLDRFISILILDAVGRTPWMRDQPEGRPLPIDRINAHKHGCLDWDSDPWLQH